MTEKRKLTDVEKTKLYEEAFSLLKYAQYLLLCARERHEKAVSESLTK